MRTRDDGATMFARYAYPPNELGYCGPAESAPLLAAAGHAPADRASPGSPASSDDQASPSDRASPRGRASQNGQTPPGASPTGRASPDGQTAPDLRRLAEQFDGAWCYLETLARGTGSGDPLDRRVVEAYWLGGPLLERLDGAEFARAMIRHFGDQYGARLSGLAPVDSPGSSLGGLPGAARAHHAYHVFEVYPWTGLLGVGDGQPALSVLDRCRVRWGRVLAVDSDRALVRSRPLTWDGTRLALGTPRTELPRWADRGRSLLPRIAAGDRVALHWDWICDALSERQLTELRRRTAEQLELTNAALTPRRWWNHASGHEGRGCESDQGDQGEGRGDHGPRAVDQRRTEL